MFKLKKHRRSLAFVSAVAMTLTMLLYLPVGTFTNNDNKLLANAEETTTEDNNGFLEDGKYESAVYINSSNYEEYGLSDEYIGFYAIENAGQLYWFAELINSVPYYSTYPDWSILESCAVLVNDIVVNENVLDDDGFEQPGDYRYWNPIGGMMAFPFEGTFDGNGHTISGLYCYVNYSSGDESYAGLIGVADSETIKNVGVIDSYFCGNYCGSIVAINQGGSIENCFSICYVEGPTYIGGLVGINGDNDNNGTYGTIRNCYTSCVCQKTSGNQKAGNFCYSNYENCTIENCYVDSDKNYYENDDIYRDEGNSTLYSVSSDEFASGQVAVGLQQGQDSDDTIAWGQTLSGKDVEKYPTLGGKIVYKVTNCQGDYDYSNTTDGHKYDEKGFCIYDDTHYEPANRNSSGNYEISNAGQLYWFADKVNNNNYASEKAVLTENIVINKSVLKSDGTPNSGDFKQWTPIGLDYDACYTGIFDGQGHTISGLYCTYDDDFVGLFGYVKNATIKNVVIVDSYIKGTQYVGLFVAKHTAPQSPNVITLPH